MSKNRKFDDQTRAFLIRFLASALLLASIICGLATVLLSTSCLAEEKNETGAAQQETTSEKAGAALKNGDDAKADAPVKWLPDLRVLAGAPTTTIDLKETLQHFCDEGYFGNSSDPILPEDVELSVVPSTDDTKVVDLQLEGTRLYLNWIPDVDGKTKVVVKASVKNDPTRRAFVSFTASSWLPNYVAILTSVVGGIGLFLLGMKRMSDGLQAIAGSRLRRMISFFTNNRFMAVGVGVVVTTLVQSSSATSVMTLGFVNSGLMTLSQAFGVIIGSNVGTTTTGWLFTLNIGALGLPILGVGAIFYLFVKKEKARNLALLTLGLGMIFFGLETLKKGLEPVSEIPEFTILINTFRATSFKGALVCVLVGCATTALAQASSATLAIAITLASLDTIDLNSSVALVIGSNIGTTCTALIASIGSSTNARRTAYFHLLFNTLGAAWVILIFFSVTMPVVNAVGDLCRFDVCGKIALSHTLFNVANTIIFVPLIDPIARLLEKVVVEKKEKKKSNSVTGLTNIQKGLPAANIEKSRRIVQQMFADCQTMLVRLEKIQRDDYKNREAIDEIFEIEKKLDAVQDETIDFISRLTPQINDADAAASAREQIRLAEELETISDYVMGVLKSNLKLKESGLKMSKELDDNFAELLQYAKESFECLAYKFSDHCHSNLVGPMNEKRDQYVARIKEIREAFLQKMFEEQLAPFVVHAVEYQLNAWRRIYEHLQNVSEAMEAPRKMTA